MKYAPFFLFVTSVALAADPAPSTAPAQATVANPVKEADLTTVTLTPEAAKRLGIATVPIVKKAIPHERLYGGEITLPLAVSEGTSDRTNVRNAGSCSAKRRRNWS